MSSSFVRERLSCKNKSGFARLSDQPTGFVSVHFFTRTTLTFPLMVFHLPSFLSPILPPYIFPHPSFRHPPIPRCTCCFVTKSTCPKFSILSSDYCVRVNFDIFFFFTTTMQRWIWCKKQRGNLKKNWILVCVEYYIFKILLQFIILLEFSSFDEIFISIHSDLRKYYRIIFSMNDFAFFVTKFPICRTQ